MIIPSHLKLGDKIKIVSPASRIKPEDVENATDWLNKQGYRVEIGKHVFDQYFQYAGIDSNRLYDLQTAMDDPDVSVIICSRGGYGTVRIADKLSYDGFFRYPKWIVGFSDITVLHSCLNRNRIASVHGVMTKHFFDEKGEITESLKSLMAVLKGEDIKYAVSCKNESNRQGEAIGELIGGNLSIIAGLQGTNCEENTDGKILFVEDVGEYLYYIDRVMHQLKMGGKLEKLAGMIVGSFTDIKDNDSPFGKNVSQIIAEAVKDYKFPVCFGFPAGHGKKNLALLFGKKWKLNVESNRATLFCKNG